MVAFFSRGTHRDVDVAGGQRLEVVVQQEDGLSGRVHDVGRRMFVRERRARLVGARAVAHVSAVSFARHGVGGALVEHRVVEAKKHGKAWR